jgi:hypothetical protein
MVIKKEFGEIQTLLIYTVNQYFSCNESILQNQKPRAFSVLHLLHLHNYSQTHPMNLSR